MNKLFIGQIYNLGMFILIGVVIGILFDIFRILRRSFKTSDIITYLQDILFWILTGIIILYSIFMFNNGEIRAYIFFGIAIGVILHIITISSFFIKYSVITIKFIKKILYIPISFLKHVFNKIMIKPIHFFVINFRKSLTKCNSKFHNMTKESKKIKKKQVKT